MVAGFLVVTCQALVSEVADCRSQCEELLGSCELLETPFDQSKFESDVSLLQGKMAACEEVRTCRLETIIVSPPGLLVEATDFGAFEAADYFQRKPSPTCSWWCCCCAALCTITCTAH